MKRIIDSLTLAATGLFLVVLASIFFPKNQIVKLDSPPQVAGISSINVASSHVDSFATVTRVIDGDTIEIEGGQRVRLIGIDTPEINKTGETGCFGQEAKNYLSKLITGQQVGLEKDVSETDKYGRLLRYVYFQDEFVNNILVYDGYARVSTYPPDVKYQQKFLDSERYARENNLGLWSKCN